MEKCVLSIYLYLKENLRGLWLCHHQEVWEVLTASHRVLEYFLLLRCNGNVLITQSIFLVIIISYYQNSILLKAFGKTKLCVSQGLTQTYQIWNVQLKTTEELVNKAQDRGKFKVQLLTSTVLTSSYYYRQTALSDNSNSFTVLIIFWQLGYFQSYFMNIFCIKILLLCKCCSFL